MSVISEGGSTPKTFTTNGIAKASAGRLVALTIAPTGAVTPTVTVYDNASAASGTALVTVKTLSATPLHLFFGDAGIEAALGIYVSSDSFTTLTVTAQVK